MKTEMRGLNFRSLNLVKVRSAKLNEMEKGNEKDMDGK